MPIHRTIPRQHSLQPAAILLSFVAVLFSPAFVMTRAQAQDAPRTPERDAAIEMQIFSRHKTADTACRFADLSLTAIIEWIDRECHLAPEQKKQLNLVGQGDISRFFHRVEVFKTEMYNRTDDHPGTEAAVAIRTLALCFQSGLFHDGSLLRKSLCTVLNADQLATYTKAVEEDRQRRQDQSIKQLISIVHESARFTPQERDRFQVLMKSDIPSCKSDGPFSIYYLAIQAGKLAEMQPTKFPNQRQREFLINLGRDSKELEPTLRQAGYFPIEEAEIEESEPSGETKKK